VAIVAPFRNLNGAPAFDRYGAEISEAVRDGLAKAPGIRSARLVRGGSTARASESATAIARRSGAQAVVQGSVMATGDAVEISVELFDGRSGQRLWFEVYDNPASQLPSVESDIVYALSRALRLL
jgi:TolB-like protein